MNEENRAPGDVWEQKPSFGHVECKLVAGCPQEDVEKPGCDLNLMEKDKSRVGR